MRKSKYRRGSADARSVTSSLEPMLLIPDCHHPYHDKQAWALMLQVAHFLKPTTVVVLGDFGDFYKVSSHSKDPRRMLSFDDELKQINAALDQLDGIKAKKKIFIAGNHEDRLSRYLADRAPDLHNLIEIPELFGLKRRKWEYVPYKSDYKLGKLYLTHDIGVAGRGSVFKCMDSYQHSNVTGHTHRMAYVVEGNAAGEARVSAQFGWLGDTEAADYMHNMKARKDWAKGFGFGYVDQKSGLFYLTPVPVINNTCVVNGKLFTVA